VFLFLQLVVVVVVQEVLLVAVKMAVLEADQRIGLEVQLLELELLDKDMLVVVVLVVAVLVEALLVVVGVQLELDSVFQIIKAVLVVLVFHSCQEHLDY
jgi:hypothetical protein